MSKAVAICLLAALPNQTTQTSAPRPVCFLVGPIIPAGPQTEPWVGTALEAGLVWYLQRTQTTQAVPIPWRDRALGDLGSHPAQPASQPWDAARLGTLLSADIVITGSCQSGSHRFAAELQICDLRKQQTARCQVAAEDLRELAGKAVRQVLATAQITTAAPAALDKPLCASPSALEYYAKALRAHQMQNLDEVSYDCSQALRYDATYVDPLVLLALCDASRQQFARALTSLQLAARQAQRADDRIDLARAQGNMGLVYRQLGQNDVAQRYLELAIATSRQAGDLYSLATALNNLAQLHVAAGRTDQALACLRHRGDVLASLGDQLAIGPNLTVIGTMYERLGQFDQALAVHRQAVEWTARVGSPPTWATALHHLGLAYQNLDQPDEAEQYYKQSIELSAADRAAPTYNNLGLIYQKRGQLDLACQSFQHALDVLVRTGDDPQRAVCLANLASVCQDMGRLPQAVEHLEQAVTILQALDHPQAGAYEQKLQQLRSQLRDRPH